MKILYDARVIKKDAGGVVEFLLQLLKFLSDKDLEIILICRKGIEKKIAPYFKRFKIINVETDTAGMNQNNITLEEEIFPKIVADIKPDIYHASFNWGCNQKINCPKIQTIHDLIPFTFNEDMTKKNLHLYKKQIKKSAQSADLIVTISNYTKSEIVKLLKIKPEKIKVIYNGADKNLFFQKPKKSLQDKINTDKYFINNGGLYPRKNLIRLLEAFAKFAEKFPHYKLIISGGTDKNRYLKKQFSLYRKKINILKLKSKVIFSGYLPKSILNYLIKKAEALVYPSLYEGFGLPIIEAMSIGTPVIASKTSALGEIIKDVALKIDPESTREISQAMIKLVQDQTLKGKLSQKGLQRASQFSWEKTGEEYLKIYQSIIEDKKCLNYR